MWHVSVFRIPVRLSGRNYLICFWSSIWVLKMKLVRFLSSFVNDHLPFNLSHHQIHKGVNVHPRVMVNGKDRSEEFRQVVWVLSVRRVMVFPVKSELENGLCIYRHPADWPFALKPAPVPDCQTQVRLFSSQRNNLMLPTCEWLQERRNEHIPSTRWPFLEMFCKTDGPFYFTSSTPSSLFWKRTWHPDPDKMVLLKY